MNSMLAYRRKGVNKDIMVLVFLHFIYFWKPFSYRKIQEICSPKMLEGKTLRNGFVFKHLTMIEKNKERKCLHSEAQFQRFYRQTAKKKQKNILNQNQHQNFLERQN